MRRFLILAAVVLLAVPAGAQFRDWNHELRVRSGLFAPEGGPDYWEEKEQDFTGDVDDLEDGYFGVDYRYAFNPVMGLMVSVDGYESSDYTEYLDFEDQAGFGIEHLQTFEVSSVTAGFVLRLGSPRSPVVPYIGAGGGFYTWRLEESGEFIDFDSNSLEIFEGTFYDEGTAPGWYAVAGLDVSFGSGFSFFAEARKTEASDELGDDFEGFGDLDLSGLQVGGGIGWKF